MRHRQLEGVGGSSIPYKKGIPSSTSVLIAVVKAGSWSCSIVKSLSAGRSSTIFSRKVPHDASGPRVCLLVRAGLACKIWWMARGRDVNKSRLPKCHLVVWASQVRRSLLKTSVPVQTNSTTIHCEFDGANS